MDDKQFDLLQTTMQWMVDDHVAPESLRHIQRCWGTGTMTTEFVDTPTKLRYMGRNMVVLCASGCCVAGNAVMVHGDRLVFPSDHLPNNLTVRTDWCVDDQNKIHSIGERAQELLGISMVEADELFEAHNTPTRLVQIATDIALDYGYTLELVGLEDLPPDGVS